MQLNVLLILALGVKLPPPEEPTVVNKTISWGFTHPGVFLNYKFELQYKSDGQTWEVRN